MNKVNRFGFSFIEGAILVLIIGILVAMAIPAFQQVRVQEQKRKVLVNLEHIATIAQEYMKAENADKVSYEELVVKKYLEAITPIDGENYRSLVVYKGKGVLEVDVDQQKVAYQYED